MAVPAMYKLGIFCHFLRPVTPTCPKSTTPNFYQYGNSTLGTKIYANFYLLAQQWYKGLNFANLKK